MSKPEWGLKRLCQSCGTKFYDLQRSPIVCPSCSTTFDPDALLKSRRSRSTSAKAAPAPVVEKPVAKPPEVAAKEIDEELDNLDDADVLDEEVEKKLGDDDDVIEDTSDLGEDDELSDVVTSTDDDENESR